MLAILYHNQGKYGEAEPLYQRAMAIREQTSGGSHPSTQNIQNNYASLLRTVGRAEEVKQLEERP